MRLRASFWTWKILKGKLEPTIMPTAYLMLDGKCVFDCAYCTHARSSTTPPKFLSRVTWKEINLEELTGLALFKRVCVQVVNYVDAHRDAIELVRTIKRTAGSLSISVSTRVASTREIDELMASGVDDLGIAIDIVDPELHKLYRGWELARTLKLIDDAARKYTGRITTHVIVGLGETDSQLYELFRYLRDRRVRVALFAFTPVPGTKLSHLSPPPLERYRKVQTLRYAVCDLGLEPEVSFDENGAILDFGNPDFENGAPGEAFVTSGCSWCTRPYYNDRPVQRELYNNHRALYTH